MLVPSKEASNKFRKLFENLAYSESYHTVFSDFLDFMILMLNINKKPEDFADLEKRWPKKEQHESFAAMMMEYATIADNDGSGFYDGLGDLFMELLSHGKNGQFFTPQPVCDMMTKMTVPEDIEDGKSVCDPTCGSGRMLLAAAKINRRLRFYGSDVDITCCKMTVVNMLLNSMEGEVAWMNTLSMEHWKSWHIRRILDASGHYIPYYVVTGPGETNFIERLRFTTEEVEEVPERVEVPAPSSKPQQLFLF